MSSESPEYDVVVIGGGPAGSTVASAVASNNHRVVLLERDNFPRYQVGESLWIATWDIFEFLGVSEAIRNMGFMKKHGGTFVWGPFEAPWSIYFAEEDGSVSTSYHVDRSQFDDLLLQRSRECGVEVRTQCRVTDLIVDQGRARGVHALIEEEPHTIRCRWVVDASGLSSILARAVMRSEPATSPLGGAAWSYFRGVTPLPSPNDGNVLTIMFSYGWFWFIPLADGTTSVGVVVSRETLRDRLGAGGVRHERVFREAVADSPFVRSLLGVARRIQPFRARVYRSGNLERYHRDGVLAVGDAACFVDPVLSTGVHLGMSGACYAAFALNTILSGGREDAALDAFDRYYRADHRTYQTMTEDLYALNRDEPDPFWQSKQVALSSERERRLEDTRSFLRRLGPIHGDMGAISRCQMSQAQHVRDTFGIGRYRREEFLNAHVFRTASSVDLVHGCSIRAPEGSCFRTTMLVKTPRHGTREVSPPDVALFELCRARQNVRELLRSLRSRFDLEKFDDGDLAEMIGQWVDAGTLQVDD